MRTAKTLPVLLLLALSASSLVSLVEADAHAGGNTHSYSVEFEIQRIDVATAAMLQRDQNKFMENLAPVLLEGFATNAVTSIPADKMNMYYINLQNAITSKTIYVEFSAVSAKAEKPDFNSGAFLLRLGQPTSEGGLGLKASSSAVSEADLMAEEATTIFQQMNAGEGVADDRKSSREMAHVFSVIGIIFIGVMLIAGYMVDLQSARRAPKVTAEGN